MGGQIGDGVFQAYGPRGLQPAFSGKGVRGRPGVHGHHDHHETVPDHPDADHLVIMDLGEIVFLPYHGQITP